jgi:ABC-type dipeptide/oligopeptide/nickel transport system ATPase component
MIALVLACSPTVLFADEPITRAGRTSTDSDPASAASIAAGTQHGARVRHPRRRCSGRNPDRIAVMYADRIVETATAREIMRTPHHPYIEGLLASIVHG